MKRFISLVLVFLLTASLTVLPAQAAQGSKLVALTFDDGPGPYTARLLDGLKARGAKATFFMVGNRVGSKAAIVSRAYQEGHQIANHSWNHPSLTSLSGGGVSNQIQSTNAQLNKAIGLTLNYMVRAPYGSTNATVRANVGAPLVYWSVDTLDWKYRNAATVKSRIVSGASDGAIILLHDIHSTSVDGALAAIDTLKAQGYEFVTVQELFRRRGVAMVNGVSYTSCKPNGTDLGPVTAPVFTSRTVNGKTEITLTAQPGAAIYYSMSDNTLIQNRIRYTGPITVSEPCTIRAMAAYDLNGSRSPIVQQTFTKPKAEAPVIRVSNGVMTLENLTPGTQLFYTLDGTTATRASLPYTEPVSLTPGTVISACAGGVEDYFDSPAVRAAYSARGNFFRDVFPGDWYYASVDQAASAGLMSGMGDSNFAPNGMTTRAQLVTLLYRYSGETVTRAQREACPFSDMEPGSYYEDAACWAYGCGLVNGYEGNLFRPNNQISRQEMSKIFVEFLRYKGKDLPNSRALAYTDAGGIAGWARPYVEAVTACGLMSGNDNGAFLPDAGATRAQTATVLMRMAALDRELPDAPPVQEAPEQTPQETPDLSPDDPSDETPDEETVDQLPDAE